MQKLQVGVSQIDVSKFKSDYDKVLKMQKENYELLKKYIDEVN